MGHRAAPLSPHPRPPQACPLNADRQGLWAPLGCPSCTIILAGFIEDEQEGMGFWRGCGKPSHPAGSCRIFLSFSGSFQLCECRTAAQSHVAPGKDVAHVGWSLRIAL